ncbi:tetratricopeptide repeat protein [Romboutsia timonensis]|uniref:tetratricopeptide repeat protein n=1 Tax=Romboutsia timonensis TaxID=1776391 RepID=UPI0008D99553|nr:tetratricopeptide repeat protein [Romboutsia timonensis]
MKHKRIGTSIFLIFLLFVINSSVIWANPQITTKEYEEIKQRVEYLEDKLEEINLEEIESLNVKSIGTANLLVAIASAVATISGIKYLIDAKSIEKLKKKVNNYSKNIDKITTKLDITAESNEYLNRGNQYYNDKNYRSAIQEYSKALEKDSNNYFAYNSRGNAYYNEAQNIKVNKEDYREYIYNALNDYNIAINLNKDYYYFYTNRGNTHKDIYFTLGIEVYLEYAQKDYEKALSLNDKYPIVYNELGNIYYHKREYETSRDYYKLASSIEPYNINYLCSLANAYYHDNKINLEIKFDAISKICDQIIRLNSNFIYAYELMGHINYQMENYGKSREYYKQAIELNKNNPIYYYWIGNTYYNDNKIIKEERIKKALKYYKKAEKLHYISDELNNKLGEIFNIKEKFNKSIEYYSKAIEINSANCTYYYNRAKVRFYNNIDKLKAYDDCVLGLKLSPNFKDLLELKDEIEATITQKI